MAEINKAAQDGQFRKQLGIAFSNANNGAIELMKAEPKLMGYGVKQLTENLKEIRTAILDDYMEYYEQVISKVGSNFKPTDTIARLKTAKNYQELRTIWLSLSQDERQNEEVIATSQEIAKGYETAQ